MSHRFTPPSFAGSVAIAVLALLAPGASADDFTGLSLRVQNASAPPGGTMQMRVVVTEPRPIIIGAPSLAYGGALGGVLGVLLPGAPDSGAAAVIGDHQLVVRVISPSGTLGLSTAVPALVVTLAVPQTTPVGATAALTLDPLHSWWLDPSGNPYPQQVKDGKFVAGGTVSIDNVLPGGGFLQAGSLITVAGSGFQPGVVAEIDGVQLASVTRVDSNTIALTTAIDTQLDGRRISVRNPDGSNAAYFSYLRAASVGKSARPLLASTETAYPVQPRSSASLIAPADGTLLGVALQNPNSSPSAIGIELWAGSSLVAGTSLTLPGASEIVRVASELLTGVVPPAGSVLRIAASAPVQILGLAANENEGSVAPLLPGP